MKKQNTEGQGVPSTKSKQLLRNTNAGDFITNGQSYQVFPEGVRVSKTKLVRGIKAENRHKALYSIGLNTLALNPDSNEDVIFNCLYSININPKQIKTPLPASELKKITANVFKTRKEEGDLVPDVNHTRKIIFNDALYPMTKQAKKAIIGKETGAMKTAKTKQRIYEMIEAWDKPEKVTIPKLSKLLGKGFTERTIKKYWHEFKALVKSLNEGLKAKKPKLKKAVSKSSQSIITAEPVKEESSNKVYDSLEDFHELVTKFKPDHPKDATQRLYQDFITMGEERNEANVRSIFMM